MTSNICRCARLNHSLKQDRKSIQVSHINGSLIRIILCRSFPLSPFEASARRLISPDLLFQQALIQVCSKSERKMTDPPQPDDQCSMLHCGSSRSQNPTSVAGPRHHQNMSLTLLVVCLWCLDQIHRTHGATERRRRCGMHVFGWPTLTAPQPSNQSKDIYRPARVDSTIGTC